MSSKKAAVGGKPGPARPGFGGFGGFTTSSSTLSYISEPPDLAAVSDANVVVSLKNLLKKDSITKAKALDDLLLYVQAHPFEKDGGVEEPVLDAWVRYNFVDSRTSTNPSGYRSNYTAAHLSITPDESASSVIPSNSS